MRGANAEQAEIVALSALGFLATAPGALERLMEQSGLDAATLKLRAADRDFQGAVLDFLLANEALLVDFCQTTQTEPRAVQMANHILSRR